MTESSVDESEISPDDVIGRVFGPEHSGRVRSMGMGAVPSNTFRNKGVRLSKLTNISAATSTSSDTDWKAKFTSLESAFKAYIIMKEGRIPDEVASFFGPNVSTVMILLFSFLSLNNTSCELIEGFFFPFL